MASSLDARVASVKAKFFHEFGINNVPIFFFCDKIPIEVLKERVRENFELVENILVRWDHIVVRQKNGKRVLLIFADHAENLCLWLHPGK